MHKILSRICSINVFSSQVVSPLEENLKLESGSDVEVTGENIQVDTKEVLLSAKDDITFTSVSKLRPGANLCIFWVKLSFYLLQNIKYSLNVIL